MSPTPALSSTLVGVCGRFTLTTPASILAELFGVSIPPGLTPRFNIAPTQLTLVVLHKPSGREGAMAQWGFKPPWRQLGDKGPGPINARSESASSSRLFGQAMKTRRCVVPASGFYEWKSTAGEKRRRPFLIEPTGAEVFALAGLWSRWQPERADPIDTFTILTCPPNAAMRPIHNRMPVILPHEHVDVWLDSSIDHPESLSSLLVPVDDRAIAMREVSTFVNSPVRDDRRCLDPPDQDLFSNRGDPSS